MFGAAKGKDRQVPLLFASMLSIVGLRKLLGTVDFCLKGSHFCVPGGPWGSWAPPGPPLGSSLARLGRPGRPLGPVWGVLGVLLARWGFPGAAPGHLLGNSWGAPGHKSGPESGS